MLPDRLTTGTGTTHATRSIVDAALMERTGLDEFTLKLLRKSFWSTCSRLSYLQKRELSECGTHARFGLMIDLLRCYLTPEGRLAFLRYLEHSGRDLDEMCMGEYPISPYLIRVFSALFGITVDFLLLGCAPCVDKVGTRIDLGPIALA